MERAVPTSTSGVIRGRDLPLSLQRSTPIPAVPVPEKQEDFDYSARSADFERELLPHALKKVRGNVAAAARMLHLSPRVLHYKPDKLAINPARYKSC